MRPGTRIFIGVTASLAMIGILFVGLIWVAFTEPWPFSRRQGPDTAYAKTMHMRVLGSEAPEGVRDLYAREEWGFGGDSIYSLRFRFDDQNIATAIITGPGWERVPSADLGRLRYLAGPRWWPSERSLRALPDAYQNRNIEVPWLDRANHQAYFQRGNFCCALAPRPPLP
ncbi:MAG: hypothetical protein EXQ47_12235 [Bryobacterales bacterium]|nr:hypothetical protein [Bryobacterales bacterium]